MSDALPAPPLRAAFVLASLVLAVTPGPGVLYIVTRSLAQGRRAGLASVAGVALGNFGNALGAALLPQFMNPAAPPIAQSVALGALFVLIAAATDSAYALAAGGVAPALARWRSAQTGRPLGHGVGVHRARHIHGSDRVTGHSTVNSR